MLGRFPLRDGLTDSVQKFLLRFLKILFGDDPGIPEILQSRYLAHDLFAVRYDKFFFFMVIRHMIVIDKWADNASPGPIVIPETDVNR